MRIGETLTALKRLDDGTVMRGAFVVLLSLSVVFFMIDVRDILATNAKLPNFDPAHDHPFLPPAGSKTDLNGPAVSPSSPIEVLTKPMRLELGPGGVLFVEGTLDIGAASRFAREIEMRGEYVRTVALNSPGGSVSDALAISKLIREKGLNTKVAQRALCASSCPIVLAGGVERLAEKDAVVGVHQLFSGGDDRPTAEQAVSAAQSTTAQVARHLDAMGIGPGLWINALETPPDRLYYLTTKDMSYFKLATGPTSAKKEK
ncbi:hypothetical protein [Ensifer sp. 4252]|uniref:COG3904 family protein n=1 Tax=Ensifer sp. 4252 TaxID=3373915 RepID=UPI003D1E9299